jgi:hypothetical protein
VSTTHVHWRLAAHQQAWRHVRQADLRQQCRGGVARVGGVGVAIGGRLLRHVPPQHRGPEQRRPQRVVRGHRANRMLGHDQSVANPPSHEKGISDKLS